MNGRIKYVAIEVANVSAGFWAGGRAGSMTGGGGAARRQEGFDGGSAALWQGSILAAGRAEDRFLTTPLAVSVPAIANAQILC